LVLVVATSALASAASSATTSTSVVIFVSFEIITHCLIWGLLISIHLLHTFVIVVRSVLSHVVVYELLKSSLTLFLVLLLKINF